MDGPYISGSAFTHFVNTYNQGGRHKGERVGQAFCNAFNITDADLFYEEDESKAWEIINEKYPPT